MVEKCGNLEFHVYSVENQQIDFIVRADDKHKYILPRVQFLINLAYDNWFDLNSDTNGDVQFTPICDYMKIYLSERGISCEFYDTKPQNLDTKL